MLVDRKLGELDAELQKVKVERKMKQQKLNNDLQENCSEQEMLREKLRLLEKEEANKVFMSNLVKCSSWHTIGV